jgi:hypothetical protein
MSDRQKSFRAGIAAVVLFLILALIGSFFYSMRSRDSKSPQAAAKGANALVESP